MVKVASGERYLVILIGWLIVRVIFMTLLAEASAAICKWGGVTSASCIFEIL